MGLSPAQRQQQPVISTAAYTTSRVGPNSTNDSGHRCDLVATPDPAKILFVTSELADYVKTGGLGDVAAALPRALRRQLDVRLLVPGYPGVLAAHPDPLIVGRLGREAGMPACSIAEVRTVDGLIVYVVMADELYLRDGSPYCDAQGLDWSDNDLRFGLLSWAACRIAEGLSSLEWTPDLLHLNDWPTALAAGYLAWRGVTTPSVLTVHNLAYQGIFDASRLPSLAIPHTAFDINGVEFHGKLSFLKTGLYYASHLTTVSATYAQEITNPELGCGLHGLLRTRADEGRLTGIVNGIDDAWNPQTAPHLTSHFGIADSLGKAVNAQRVREEFGLSVSQGPLFAIVSRLIHQKGLDLVAEAANKIVAQGGQIVLTGRGERDLEEAWRKLARQHAGNIAVRIGFDEGQAQRIFAGSDFLLMPSRYEPCGLSQMYAQRMGSLPIARRTGGLAETIEDGVTGFLFGVPTADELLCAVSRAMDAFSVRSRLEAMRRAAMTQPFEWIRSAASYQALYFAKLERSTETFTSRANEKSARAGRSHIAAYNVHRRLRPTSGIVRARA